MLAFVGILFDWVPEHGPIAAEGDVGALSAGDGSGGQTRALGKRLTDDDIRR